MNEKFIEIISKYVDKFGGLVEKAIDTAMEEIPKIILEYLEWSFFKEISDGIFSILFLVVLILLGRKGYKFYFEKSEDEKKTKWQEYSSDYDAGPIIFSCILITVYVTAFFITSFSIKTSIETLVKIKVSPRIFLIDKTIELMNEQKRCNGGCK